MSARLIRRSKATSLPLIGALLVSVAAAGCSAPLIGSVAEARIVASGRWTVIEGLDVPPVRGADGCGAQGLATVLAHLDPDLDPERLGEELPWHDDGATPVDLLLAARDRGFTATLSSGTWEHLADDVGQGRPPLVMFDASPEVRTLTSRIPSRPVLHWGVVSGLADDGSSLLIAARSTAHHVIDREEFLRRWAASSNCRIAITP